MDKRKEKSRQLIIENFIKLMQKKDIAKISMKDIAKLLISVEERFI